jgi:uncharacterized protein YjbI with pentapeptide repeats
MTFFEMNADLTGADLRKAKLANALLRSADLREANLGEAEARGAKYDSQTHWPDGFDPRRAGAINLELR